MTGRASANWLESGKRLHLHHGPIDLIIEAEGRDDARTAAFLVARECFASVLQDLADELPELRERLTTISPRPEGAIARRMHRATLPFADVFVTRMAAVAGSVADAVLDAMVQRPLERAYVNNGGDIAIHLGDRKSFTMAMSSEYGEDLGRIRIASTDDIGGIATSGRGGRSLSMGIADSVTVLARNAAIADVAATLIANAVDLPGHSSIVRCSASEGQPDSDLGERLVVTALGVLSRDEVAEALTNGVITAETMLTKGLIEGAALFLRGQARVVGDTDCLAIAQTGVTEYA